MGGSGNMAVIGFTASVKVVTAKNENPPTTEKLPPYFGFTASAEIVTAKKRKSACRQKITV